MTAMDNELYYTERRDPALRHFVEDFRTIIEGGARGRPLLDALRAPLDGLLDTRGWLEQPFLSAIPGDVATWALYRSRDPDLCLFTMVVPPGMRTRVHNHLTDGWVALLQGGQLEPSIAARMTARVPATPSWSASPPTRSPMVS
jgi:predicted metal-dependent enzyme (double-stranded beta helix superfamily)